MPKWLVISVGVGLTLVLTAAVLGVSIEIAYSMWNTCQPELDLGRGLSVLGATPGIAVRALLASGAAYAIAASLPFRGSFFLAIGLAVLVAGVLVVVSASELYDASVASPICPDGAPTWWPDWMPA